MLRIILRLVLLLLAVRVVYSMFTGGARKRAAKPPEVPDDGKSTGRLGGKIVDADFEDLPGEGRKS